MLNRSSVMRLCFVALGVLGAAVATAQPYPSKALRIITSAPGGGSDFVARLIAQGLADAVGQPVVVENRSSYVAMTSLFNVAPDGYTFLLYGGAIWIEPLMQEKPQWDPMKDITPIILTSVAPNILVVHPSVAANSVKDLIALAKAKPGQLNYGAGPAGTSTHLAGELFKSMAGVNITKISYKSSPAILTSLLGGEIQMMFNFTVQVAAHVKSGKLKALAVTTKQPSVLAPGLPTVAEDLPGFESDASFALFAPAKTSAAVVQRINQEVARVINRPDAKEKLFNMGFEVMGGSAADLRAKMKSEITSMGKVIKDAGIRAD